MLRVAVVYCSASPDTPYYEGACVGQLQRVMGMLCCVVLCCVVLCCVVLCCVVLCCVLAMTCTMTWAATNALPTFPNIEYVTFGYDIVKGNPLAAMTDPGWQYPIIEMSYAMGNSWDNKYAIPDWLEVRTAAACSYSGVSSTMTDASSYQV